MADLDGILVDVATRYAAQVRLGRELTEAEDHIDVVGGSLALDKGKAKLAEAIRKEYVRTLRVQAKGIFAIPTLTGPMVDALVDLYLTGREHAMEEIRSMGVEPEKPRRDSPPTFFTEEDNLRRLEALRPGLGVNLSAMLGGLAVRIDDGLVAGDASGLALATIADRMEREAPGVLDVASRLVSSGFSGGLSDVYAANEHLFSEGWQYTAVMDGATCDECRRHDGEVFHSLADLYRVLPNFGPNPSCYGDGRCRCRGIPNPPAPTPPPPVPLPPGPESIAVVPIDENVPREGMEKALNAAREAERVLIDAGFPPGTPIVHWSEEKTTEFASRVIVEWDPEIPDHAIAAWDRVYYNPALGERARLGGRFGGGYEENARAIAAGQMPTYQFTSDADVLLHEFGHVLENSLSTEQRMEWEAFFKEHEGEVGQFRTASAYGQENALEAFAEAFLSYVRGRETAPEYEALMRRMLSERGAFNLPVEKPAYPFMLGDAQNPLLADLWNSNGWRLRTKAMESYEEWKKTKGPLKDLLAEREKANRAVQRDFVRIMRAKDPDYGKGVIQVAEGSDEAAVAKLQEAAKFYPKDWIERAGPIRVVHGGRSAGYLRPEVAKDHVPTIMISETEKTPLVAHEMAHWLEDRLPEVQATSRAFLERRTEGKAISKLDDAYNSTVADGGFVDPYIGRIYEGRHSTEVLSMGMEAILGGAIPIEQDLDHLSWLLRVLSGDERAAVEVAKTPAWKLGEMRKAWAENPFIQAERVSRAASEADRAWQTMESLQGLAKGARVPTIEADAALDDVLAAGRTLRQEIESRMPEIPPADTAVLEAEAKDKETEYHFVADARDAARKRVIDLTAEAQARVLAREFPGQTASSLDSYEARNKFRVAWSSDPEYLAAKDALRLAEDELRGVKDKWNATKEAILAKNQAVELQRMTARRALLKETLEDSGLDIGGHLTYVGSKDVGKTLETVLNHVPGPWVAASNERAAVQPLNLRKSQSRAHYAQDKWTRKVGRHDELLTQGMSTGSGAQKTVFRVKTTGETGDIDTGAHEFGHRVEHVVPIVKRLEWTFYQRRTNNSLDAMKSIYGGRSERAREDKFSELYMGKDYGNTPRSYFELLSMGLEDVLFGVHGADEEFVEFIYGLMSLA